jgi:hypothetical protein
MAVVEEQGDVSKVCDVLEAVAMRGEIIAHPSSDSFNIAVESVCHQCV